MTALQLQRTPNGLEGIRLPLNSYKTFVPLSDIIRLEGQRNYTLFVLKSGHRILVSKTIKVYEELLPADFIRVNRGCIINITYVDFTFNGNFRLKDGYKIPVSRRNIKRLEALRPAA